MRLSNGLTLSLTLLLFAALPSAHADGSAANGHKVYQEECSDCHSVTVGKNKKGPTLFGVVGRASASVPDFKYSDAMKAAGKTWTADALDEYIRAPKQTVKGGKMKYDGLDDAAARADIIAFLQTLR